MLAWNSTPPPQKQAKGDAGSVYNAWPDQPLFEEECFEMLRRVIWKGVAGLCGCGNWAGSSVGWNPTSFLSID